MLTYENIAAELLVRVPSFARVRERSPSFISYRDDRAYLVFGDFGRFLQERMSQPTGDESTLRASFDLLDEMLTSADVELVNLAQVGVFEQLVDDPAKLRKAKQYLSDNAKVVLDRWLTKWIAWLSRN